MNYHGAPAAGRPD